MADNSQTEHLPLALLSGQLGQLGQRAGQLGQRLDQPTGTKQNDRLGQQAGQHSDQRGQGTGQLGEQGTQIEKRKVELDQIDSCAPTCPPSRSPFLKLENWKVKLVRWLPSPFTMAAGEGE